MKLWCGIIKLDTIQRKKYNKIKESFNNGSMKKI